MSVLPPLVCTVSSVSMYEAHCHPALSITDQHPSPPGSSDLSGSAFLATTFLSSIKLTLQHRGVVKHGKWKDLTVKNTNTNRSPAAPTVACMDNGGELKATRLDATGVLIACAMKTYLAGQEERGLGRWKSKHKSHALMQIYSIHPSDDPTYSLSYTCTCI